MAVKSPAKIARIKKWLRALRSGKYKQTELVLRSVSENGTPIGHCCLGVLCDVVDPKGWLKKNPSAHKLSEIEIEDSQKSAGMISPALLRSVGLTYNEGTYLASMNDCGDSFNKIADEITRMTGVK